MLEFLTQKGKYMPIPLDKVATVVTARGMFSKENGQRERLAFRDRKPKELEEAQFVLVGPRRRHHQERGHGERAERGHTTVRPKRVTLPCNTRSKRQTA